MNITPEAIEAAARAEYEYVEADGWEKAHPSDRHDYRESARVALEAALPYLTHTQKSSI